MHPFHATAPLLRTVVSGQEAHFAHLYLLYGGVDGENREPPGTSQGASVTLHMAPCLLRLSSIG